eukprot:1149893-Pelagomonas_calceolata.AAC.1
MDLRTMNRRKCGWISGPRITRPWVEGHHRNMNGRGSAWLISTVYQAFTNLHKCCGIDALRYAAHADA